jgi:tRNA pseudouridine38-40 synthase
LTDDLAVIILILEYEGGKYYGSQLQKNGPTIQGELEKAVKSLTGQTARIQLASRTDAGVHALGQVAKLRIKNGLALKNIIGGLNHYLPPDIAVKKAFKLAKDIDVRRKAVNRQYFYKIINSKTPSPLDRRFAYQIRETLNVKKMNEAAALLVGKQDYASFASGPQSKTKSTVRDVKRAEFKREGESVIFHMEANAFLTHQVRSTVGALIKVGLGKMMPQEFKAIIEARQIGLAGPAAPPQGLYLKRINYAEEFKTEK